jgi:hypothetical protein
VTIHREQENGAIPGRFDAVRPYLPICVVTLLYLVVTLLTFNQIEEDAFIYFRLAANLAEGHGVVFNLGGEHIESGSGLIWQLLMAAAWILPLHMLVKAKLLGIAFGCLALWLTFRIARRLVSDPILQCVPSLLLAFSAPFFCWSQRGLETSFHVCALLLLCDVCCDDRYRRYWYLPAILLSCSRPEGFLMLAALLPFFVLYRKELPRLWHGIAIVAAALVVLTLLRLGYFHDPFPHPFYIKADTHISDGVLRIRDYLVDNLLLFALAPAALAYVRPDSWSRQRVVVMSFLAATAGWASVAPEGLAPYFRHMAAVLPFLFLVAVAGLDKLARGPVLVQSMRAACIVFAVSMLVFSRSSYTPEPPKPSIFAYAARIALQDPAGYAARIGQILAHPNMFFADLVPEREIQTTNPQLLRDPINTHYQATAGRFLELNYPKGITIVYDQMGQTPWYAGRDKRFIDTWGLLTKQIGYTQFQFRTRKSTLLRTYDELMFRLAGSLWPDETRRGGPAAVMSYIFDEEPELIIINDLGAQYPRTLPGRLSRDPRLRERYTPAYLVNKVVRIYERKDIYSRERNRVPRGAVVKAIVP